MTASTDLLLECVSLGLQCNHKIFVCENVCELLGVKHGAIMSKLLSLASDNAYVMHMCHLDPTDHGGCQTRLRPYFVFVQSSLHQLRGTFDVPTPPPTGATHTILEHLMPVDGCPFDELRSKLDWTQAREFHLPDYQGALMEWTCSTSPSTCCKAYNVHGRCPTICTDGVTVFDPRRGAECFRWLHSTELCSIQGMHPDFRFPDGMCERERVHIVGLSMDGHCIRALGDAMHKYIHGVGTTQPSLTCCSVVTEENVTDAVAYKTARKANPHTSGRGNTDLSLIHI